MATEAERFVGIDVSKDKLDVAVRPTGMRWTEENNEKGTDGLVVRLQELKPSMVILEATGGLETLAVAAMATVNLPVVVANPRQVRDFAKATGRLAKTDTIDADIIARFGEALRPEIRPLKDSQSRDMSSLVSRRRQLVEMLTAEKNRLNTATSLVRKDIQAHIQWLEKRLKDVNRELRKKILGSPLWKEKDEIVRSAPGAGKVLSTTLISQLPELGTLSGRKIGALVGVAPLNRDSGRHRGKRSIWGGRADIRRVLYMATLSATRCNPVIRPFYQRLRKAGKEHKVAMTACMRKFLVILNVMVKTHSAWRCDPTSAS